MRHDRGLLSQWPYPAAAGLGFSAVIEVWLRGVVPGRAAWFGLVLGLAVTLPVALARLQPVLAAALVGGGTLVALLAQYPQIVSGLIAFAFLWYLVGRHRPGRVALLTLAPFTALALALPESRQAGVALVILAGCATAAGAVTRWRIEASRRRDSDRMMADTLLEHAARGERARIARELHDVVAHHISMIAVQAEAARLTTPGMPAEGSKKLIAIGDTARAALTEMRRLLGVLRDDAAPVASRRPQPGLQELNELLDEARQHTVGSTRLIVSGRVAPLDPGVELTAYRIVQEALTNARRHAPGAAVDVELVYRPECLHLKVRDNGPGPIGGHGHGLIGMQERAAMVGGTLTTGPGAIGGFLVEATLPLDGEEK